MGTWIKDTLTTGALASASTTAALAIMGKMEIDNAVAPINAVSHILWGEKAAHSEQFDARHTLAGAAINTMAITGWAGVHELLMPRRRAPSGSRALLTGVAVSALAYITDYHVVPKRFTPGVEKRLSSASLFGMYATLALSLAAGSLARDR